MLKFGDKGIQSLFYGSVPVVKAYYGTEQVWPNLPYDAEVEYLESTGTQWIDTGVLVPDNVLVEGTFVLLANENTVIAGGRYSTTRNSLAIWANTVNGGAIRFDFQGTTAGGSVVNTVAATLGQEYRVSKIGYRNFIDGVEVASNNQVTYNPEYPCYLFAVNSSGTAEFIGHLRIKQFSISGLRDFVPVRFTNEQGQTEGAMYDRSGIGGMNPDGSARHDGLYRNRGTGAFVIGPDKVAIETDGYVQNGLIGMWDAKENAGVGLRYPNGTKWANLGSLGSTYDFTTLDQCSWKTNAFHLDTFSSKAICENSIPHENIQTMEVYFKVDDSYNITTNDNRIRVFTLGTRFLTVGWQMTRRMLAWDVNAGKRGWMFSTGYAIPSGQSGTSMPLGTWGFSVVYPTTDTDYNSGSTPVRIVRNGVQWSVSSWQVEGDATIPKGATSPISQFVGNPYGTAGATSGAGICGIIGDVYCIRLYSRQLTLAEQQANYAIDVQRYGQ